MSHAMQPHSVDGGANGSLAFELVQHTSLMECNDLAQILGYLQKKKTRHARHNILIAEISSAEIDRADREATIE